MTRSDWGDWLPRAIERADPDGVAVWYLGCNGLAIKGSGGTTLFVDPYVGVGDPPRTVRMIPIPFDPADVGRVDAVMATHEHSDHVHGPSQAPLLEDSGAAFVAPEDSVAVAREENWTDRWDVASDQFDPVEPGDERRVGEFTVSVEAANDPDATDPVAYVVDHDAGTLVHPGDARPGDAFEFIGREYDVDVGVVAFGSAGMVPDKQTREPTYTRWYNDEEQAVEAARQLCLDRLVPTHWDMWRGLRADPDALRPHVASFEYPGRLEVVEIGDRFDLV